MATVMVLVSLTTSKNMNPMTTSLSILFLSLLATTVMFKSTLTSWVSFITILTFASGMMTLFMYTASLVSNEINKTKKLKKISMLMAIALLIPHINHEKGLQTLKMFSGQSTMIITAMILITTMLSVATHGHHPNQTLTTSF